MLTVQTFFIPENNMFKEKVIGAPREELLSQLIVYYEMGMVCLLRSPSLNIILSPAMCNPLLTVPFTDGHVLSLLKKDKTICHELLRNHYFHQSKEECYVMIMTVTKCLEFPLSRFQILALQHAMSEILAQIGFILTNNSTNKRNKTWYKLDKMALNMLRLSSRIGPMSQMLCLAVYFYNTGRYHKVQEILQIFKERFSQPFILFGYPDFEGLHYIESIGKYHVFKRMNKA